MIAQNERKKLEIETNSLVEKHKVEIRVSELSALVDFAEICVWKLLTDLEPRRAQTGAGQSVKKLQDEREVAERRA